MSIKAFFPYSSITLLRLGGGGYSKIAMNRPPIYYFIRGRKNPSLLKQNDESIE